MSHKKFNLTLDSHSNLQFIVNSQDYMKGLLKEPDSFYFIKKNKQTNKKRWKLNR